MNAAARAVVVHLTPRRIRIKIPGWERRERDFVALRGVLEGCPGVIDVRANALVASIVIHCGDGFEVASVRHCFTSFELVVPAAATVSAARHLRHIDAPARTGSRPAVSSRLAVMAIELAIAVWARRLEGLIIEWILQAVIQALFRRRHRAPAPPRPLAAPRRRLAAAAA